MTHLERIDAIRAANLAPKDAPSAPDAVIERLAHAARKMRPGALARLPEPRRSATLAALFGALEQIALDEALELFDQLIDQTVKDAARAYTASRMRTLRDLDAAALILAQAVEFVFLEERDDASLRQALAEIGSAAIENAIERTRHLARPPDDRHFQELCASWRRIKRLFEGLLGRITFEAAPVAEPVREALAFLAHTPDWTRASMRAAPTACVSTAWSRHVFTVGAKPPGATVTDNRAYVFAVLEATRKALRRRDIFVAASTRFADPNRGMLEDAAWASARPAVLRALGRSEDARAQISSLCEQLDAAYQRANSNLPYNPDLRFENDDLVLSHLDRLEEPPSLIALRRDIQVRLPKGAGTARQASLRRFSVAIRISATSRSTSQARRASASLTRQAVIASVRASVCAVSFAIRAGVTQPSRRLYARPSRPEVAEAEGDRIEGADAHRLVVLPAPNQHPLAFAKLERFKGPICQLDHPQMADSFPGIDWLLFVQIEPARGI